MVHGVWHRPILEKNIRAHVISNGWRFGVKECYCEKGDSIRFYMDLCSCHGRL